MIIKRVKISNYKTYLDLDLDLSVQENRPIILIGGMNGGGKTTLFEAITGALYGLKIKNKNQFEELLNNGANNIQKPEISLEVTFVGRVLGNEQKYILRRTYKLNPSDNTVESVSLNMNGNVFVYGTATPTAQRISSEQQVNKIIKANLPQELSKYFLFDAMQSSELLKENVFAHIIKDNIENVMGFNKYVQMKRAAEKLQQAKAAERLAAEKEKVEYEKLCSDKLFLVNEKESLIEEQEQLSKYMLSVREDYEQAKSGARSLQQTQMKVTDIKSQIEDIKKSALAYSEDLKNVVENMETNIILPRMASDMANQINNIIRAKDELRQSDSYSPEKVKEITKIIIDYLQEISVVTSDIKEEVIVNYILSKQEQVKDDPYSFLDESDVMALTSLLQGNGQNGYTRLETNRQDCEAKIANLPNLQMQLETLEKQLVGGDEELIKAYENAESRQKNIITLLIEQKSKIQILEKRIHQYDIAIQQEPDVKYDTLVKLKAFFDEVANSLLKRKRAQIETEMKEQLNKLLISYKGYISRVELSDSLENFSIKLFHKAGNEISLNQLNAASKQIFIQVLLKVLRNLGDYNPPVMIDTVMGVLDNESRDALMEEYFPQLAEQTILLCTTSEIRKDSDYRKLEAYISKTYTLARDVENQCTTVGEGYFGVELNID